MDFFHIDLLQTPKFAGFTFFVGGLIVPKQNICIEIGLVNKHFDYCSEINVMSLIFNNNNVAWLSNVGLGKLLVSFFGFTYLN